MKLAALLLLSFVMIGNSPALFAGKDLYNTSKENLGIEGYDPVSYFVSPEPLPGKPEILASHEGVNYYFSSEENKKAFLEKPDQYAPQYGGWCATAIADGKKVSVSPTNYVVSDGQLFLFYKGLFGNAKKDWDKEPAALEKKADQEWKKILDAHH